MIPTPSYELIIERHQPPCGGKPTKVFDFQTVETEDPVAYVRSQEPEAELEIDRSRDGVIRISFVSGIQPVIYEFTEA